LFVFCNFGGGGAASQEELEKFLKNAKAVTTGEQLEVLVGASFIVLVLVEHAFKFAHLPMGSSILAPQLVVG
jgi:hypothetical protein